MVADARFLFVACQAGAEAALKGEMARLWPTFRLAFSRPGFVTFKLPDGVRLAGSNALAEFYPLLGDALKQRFAGWTAFLLSGDTRLPKLIGLKASRRTPLFNGALECRLYEYRLVAGSMRQPRPGTKLRETKGN